MADVTEGRFRLFLFESSTHVLWAEEVAQEEGIPVEVVPAPEDTRDRCGLSIRTFRERAGEMEGRLREEGIPYQLHHG